MLAELLYPPQGRYAPLHLAAWCGHTTCVEHLLSTPGIDVNIKDYVSWFSDYIIIMDKNSFHDISFLHLE